MGATENVCSSASLGVVHEAFPWFAQELKEACSQREPMDAVRKFYALGNRVGSMAGLRDTDPKSQSLVREIAGLCSMAMQTARTPDGLATLAALGEAVEASLLALGKERGERNQILQERIEQVFREPKELGHGLEGVVFYMEIPEDDIELRRAVEGDVPGDVTESAIKVFKLKKKGAVQEEFRRQELAYNILAKYGNKAGKPMAGVPRPFLFRDVTLSPESAAKLQRYGCSVAERADVLMMDFVPGNHMEYYLFEKAISLKDSSFEIASLDADALALRVGEEFDFVRIPKNPTPQQRWQARTENMAKVYRFLKAQGVTVNPAVVKAMKNTLDVWSDADFQHGDLHERNVMFTGSREELFSSEEESLSGTVKFIDFGPMPHEDMERVSAAHDYLVANRLAELK